LLKKKKKKKRKAKEKKIGRTEFFHAGGPSSSDLPFLRPTYVGLSKCYSTYLSKSFAHQLPSNLHPKSIPIAYIMSFLFGGAPKMSSAEKISAAETEVEMISDMFNR
jgi:hypothetical protein